MAFSSAFVAKPGKLGTVIFGDLVWGASHLLTYHITYHLSNFADFSKFGKIIPVAPQIYLVYLD